MASFVMDIEELEKNVKAVLSEVYHSGDELIVTRKDRPWVKIVAADEDALEKE